MTNWTRNRRLRTFRIDASSMILKFLYIVLSFFIYISIKRRVILADWWLNDLSRCCTNIARLFLIWYSFNNLIFVHQSLLIVRYRTKTWIWNGNLSRCYLKFLLPRLLSWFLVINFFMFIISCRHFFWLKYNIFNY